MGAGSMFCCGWKGGIAPGSAGGPAAAVAGAASAASDTTYGRGCTGMSGGSVRGARAALPLPSRKDRTASLKRLWRLLPNSPLAKMLMERRSERAEPRSSIHQPAVWPYAVDWNVPRLPSMAAPAVFGEMLEDCVAEAPALPSATLAPAELRTTNSARLRTSVGIAPVTLMYRMLAGGAAMA